MPDEIVTPAEPAAAEATPDFDSINPGDAFASAAEPAAVETPATEPVITEPVVGDAPVTPVTQPDTHAPSWDGYEKAEVDAALAISRGLRTPDGVKYMVGQGLQRLYPNIDVAQLQQLVQTGQITPSEAAAVVAEASVVDPTAGIADDDVVTGAELRTAQEAAYQRALTEIRAEVAATVQPVTDEFQAQRESTAQATVDGTLVELLGTDGQPDSVDPQTAGLVLQHAAKYIDENDWHPQSIRAAIVRGHADAQAQVQAAHAAFLARQANIAATTPTSIGGSQSTGGEEPEVPESMEEAHAMAESMGFFKW